jgi:hypothetical protein
VVRIGSASQFPAVGAGGGALAVTVIVAVAERVGSATDDATT